MKHLILTIALTLAACGPGPKSGQVVDIGPGPHMTSAHPAFTACGGNSDRIAPGKYRCR